MGGTTKIFHHRQLIKELLEKQSGFWVTCDGSSMEPTIRKGERLWVYKAKPKTGDVVVFLAKDQRYILHRVSLWPNLGPWFWHCGDASGPLGPRKSHKKNFLGVVNRPFKKSSVFQFLTQQPKFEWKQLRARLKNRANGHVSDTWLNA